jgi:hypothetical protein
VNLSRDTVRLSTQGRTLEPLTDEKENVTITKVWMDYEGKCTLYLLGKITESRVALRIEDDEGRVTVHELPGRYSWWAYSFARTVNTTVRTNPCDGPRDDSRSTIESIGMTRLRF